MFFLDFISKLNWKKKILPALAIGIIWDLCRYQVELQCLLDIIIFSYSIFKKFFLCMTTLIRKFGYIFVCSIRFHSFDFWIDSYFMCLFWNIWVKESISFESVWVVPLHFESIIQYWVLRTRWKYNQANYWLYLLFNLKLVESLK